MRNILGVLCALSLILVGVRLAQAGEDDARAVVDKSIQAIGGEAKLAKHKAVTFSEKGTYYGMGKGQPYTGTYAIQWPGQFRMEILNVFTLVLDGDKGWVKSMGEVKEMTKEQLAAQQHNQRAGWMSSLLPLRDKAFQLKTLPDAKVGTQETRVVVAARPDWPEAKLYFDKTSNYLVKMEYRTKAPELKYKDVTADIVYSDFRDVDGVKVAHKMVMKQDGNLFVEAELTSMEAKGKLDAKTFARPE
jgi:outer membrane lipoprotein-sorting protein